MVIVDPEAVKQNKNEEQAAIFSAFSDPTRLKLFILLAHQDSDAAAMLQSLRHRAAYRFAIAAKKHLVGLGRTHNHRLLYWIESKKYELL